jgi:hypothetical protein
MLVRVVGYLRRNHLALIALFFANAWIESSRPDPATGTSPTGWFTIVNNASGTTQDVTWYAECATH